MPKRRSNNVDELFRQACINLFIKDQWFISKNHNRLEPIAQDVMDEVVKINKVEDENLLKKRWYQREIETNLAPLPAAQKAKETRLERDSLEENQSWDISKINSPIKLLSEVYQYTVCIDEPFTQGMAQKIHDLGELLEGTSPEVVYEIVAEYSRRAEIPYTTFGHAATLSYFSTDTTDLDLYVQTLNKNNSLRLVMLDKYHRAKAYRNRDLNDKWRNGTVRIESWEKDPPFDPLDLMARKLIRYLSDPKKSSSPGREFLTQAKELLAVKKISREQQLHVCYLVGRMSTGTNWNIVNFWERNEKLLELIEWFINLITPEYSSVPEYITDFFGIAEWADIPTKSVQPAAKTSPAATTINEKIINEPFTQTEGAQGRFRGKGSDLMDIEGVN